MMWILKEECKILNSAVKFNCWSWKFKSAIKTQTMNFGEDCTPYKASLILTSTRFGDLAS